RGSRVVPGDDGDVAVAERVHESNCIPHHIEYAEGIGIRIIGSVPARGPAISPLVRGKHVIARLRQRQHYLTPAIGELRKAVHEENCRPVRLVESCLEDVHGQTTVDVRYSSGADTCRNRTVAIWCETRKVRPDDRRLPLACPAWPARKTSCRRRRHSDKIAA